MKATVTQREYLNWQRYWRDEPWGPLRDNMHAAIIAREMIRPHLREGAKAPELEAFMLRPARDRIKAASQKFLNMLKGIAKVEKSND